MYNVVDDEPAPTRDWLPELARALDAKPPRRVPRWIGRLLAGQAATVMMTEVRGASEQEGEARVRLAAALCELAAGLRAGTRLSDDRPGTRRAPPVGVRHRLPDARQRERGGGRGAGGVPPPPPGARRTSQRIESPRAYLSTVVSRLSIDHCRSGARPARDLRRRVAAGAARGEHRRGSRPEGRDGGLAVARVPRPAREPVARAARRLPAARGVRRAL